MELNVRAPQSQKMLYASTSLLRPVLTSYSFNFLVSDCVYLGHDSLLGQYLKASLKPELTSRQSAYNSKETYPLPLVGGRPAARRILRRPGLCPHMVSHIHSCYFKWYRYCTVKDPFASNMALCNDTSCCLYGPQLLSCNPRGLSHDGFGLPFTVFVCDSPCCG